MTILIISDLHLEEDRLDMTEIFLRFLKKEAKEAKALYILGDFFETWIGDDDLTPFNSLIINALNKATAGGVPIFFMHGNRDFLLGKKFFKTTGCSLLPEEYIIDLYGSPTLLMHGDTLCTQDVAYLKFRKKIRNRFIQACFLWKSLKNRKKIAEHYRQKSKEHIGTIADHIMDVTESEVSRKMRLHQVKHLIHGHTHRQAIHHFQLDSLPATRIVLGAWHECGNVLVCDEGRDPYFITLK